MRKIILTILVSFLSLSAFAERYVMVTHGEGKDPFWPVVQKGGFPETFIEMIKSLLNTILKQD